MKYSYLILALLALSPLSVWAETYVSGVDDTAGEHKANIDPETQKKLDDSILNYYKSPSTDKVNTVLDIMASSPLLERKMAWAPLVGFFTVILPANKDKVMSWMSRNDYNTYAQYVIVNALSHAQMRESALLFAKAHKWSADDLYNLRETSDNIDLKKLVVAVPGHIDTLWGAFFASGDPVYVEEIINAMITTTSLPAYANQAYFVPEDGNPMAENKVLAAKTLRDYARDHKAVYEAVEKRYNAEADASPTKELYKEILGK